MKISEKKALVAVAASIILVWLAYWLTTGKLTTANQLTGLPRIADGCLILGFALIWNFCSIDDSIIMRINVATGAVIGFAIFIPASFTGQALLISSVALILGLLAVVFLYLGSISAKFYGLAIYKGKFDIEALAASFIPGYWLAFGMVYGTVVGYLALLPFLVILLVLYITMALTVLTKEA